MPLTGRAIRHYRSKCVKNDFCWAKMALITGRFQASPKSLRPADSGTRQGATWERQSKWGDFRAVWSKNGIAAVRGAYGSDLLAII